ncbi:MAG: NAD(P)(+) transhydrogenase (Re/Si-specific) subunit alpha, partial [Helicobacter sp.]|nr:NAD(P)(+) transhydrogenase (Re/Si-specific) subunit alpha [Helicobacter sp.]
MNISIPKEQTTGELRVAATPSSVAQLIKLGFDVCVEQGAGKHANFSDSDYEQAGATIKTKKQIFTGDVILKVNAPTDSEIALIKEGATLIGLMNAAHSPKLLEKLQA